MPATVIRGARIVDGRSDEVRVASVVVGGDGRIEAIRPDLHDTADGATVIDATGLTLVPGLIDCHVHLQGRHEFLHEWIARTFTETVGAMLESARGFVEAGVTTARDAGGAPVGIKRMIARGGFPGPRLQISATPLSITGGHGDPMTPAGANIRGDFPAAELPPGIADGIDAVRRAARLQVRAGADWIKVMATGGVYSLMDTPGAVQYSTEEMAVMVQVAEEAGLCGVMAHAENARGIKNAIRAGVRSIEHGDGIDGEAIAMMLERDVALVPTWLINEEMLREDRVQSGLTPPWAVEKVKVLLVEADERFRHAVGRGVRVAMGTDGLHGSHLPTELSLMVEHGLSALGALRAATIHAAELLGLDEDIGTVEVGKAADLLLLDFDPLTQPERWRDPSAIAVVFQAGRVIADRRAAAT